MALIPETIDNIVIGETIEIQQEADLPSMTYGINFETGQMVGMIDGKEAIEQAIYMILNTERFAYLIYSWNYGFERSNVMGKNFTIVQSDLQRYITEALTQDGRITDVTDFSIEIIGKNTAAVRFTAVSVFGDSTIETEVKF